MIFILFLKLYQKYKINKHTKRRENRKCVVRDQQPQFLGKYIYIYRLAIAVRMLGFSTNSQLHINIIILNYIIFIKLFVSLKNFLFVFVIK